MKILAIHAHPDDVEFLCSGALALLKDQGHDIAIATVSNGDKGSLETSNEETARIRKGEAQRAAAVIGATYGCVDFNDYEIFDDDLSRRRVTEFIRAINPDVIITAPPQDYHADHEACSHLVRHAAFIVGAPNYQTGDAPVMKAIPTLYYTDPTEGKDILGNVIRPDFCVDVSTVIETKKTMLEQHASQREWLRAYHGMDHYIHSMLEWNQKRGLDYGFAYGEGFRMHKGHGYPQAPILEEALSEFVKR